MTLRNLVGLVVVAALASVVTVVGQAPRPDSAARATPTYATPEAHRAAFLKLIDRPRVPPAPELRPMPDDEGLSVQHLALMVEAGDRATALVLTSKSQTGRRPAIVYLHGTGGSKDRSLPRLKELAQRGFVVVGLDGRYHGERRSPEAGDDPYGDAIVEAFRTGHGRPFLYDSVWDIMRVLDYLQTRDDVDPARLGVTGFSKGGMEAYLAAAVDTRIAAVVPKHGVQSFRWGLDHGAWDSRAWSIRSGLEGAAAEAKQGIGPPFIRAFYDKLTPGLYGEFDGPAMLPLIAPRPLLVISGDSDPRTPQAGVREAARAAEAAYRTAGAADHFEHRPLPDTGHEETAAGNQAAIEWFVRWLKP